MKVPFVIWVCVGLLSVHTAEAQSLSGAVTDADSGEPLSGATVYIPLLQTGAAADAEGHYEVELQRAGSYRVIYSFLGYQSETRTLTVGPNGLVENVRLYETAIEAAPVTITAKAQASDILSTPQAVTVIDAEELAENRGATALDALDHATGVRLIRTGTGIAKPMIRGLSSQRVLVIQNGVRQEGQQWGDEHGPELDAFDIDRIEVVKGPASLLYGSDALGGVVHVSSRDLFGYTDAATGSAVFQGMSNARLGATHLSLGGVRSAYAYEATGTWKRAGSYDTPDGLVPNTGLKELNGSARVGWRRDRTRVTAEYEHFGTQLGMFELEEGEEGDHLDEDHHVDEASRFVIGMPFQRVQHDRGQVGLELPLGGNRLEVVSTLQQNRRKEYGHEHGAEDEDVEPHPFADDDHGGEPELFLRLLTATADARVHHRPVGRLFGTIGVSGMHQINETLAEETLVPEAQTLNGAVFVYEEYMLPRLTLSGGLRYDARTLRVEENEDLGVADQTRNYRAMSGALGLAWQPEQGLSLALNAGRAWRAPVLIELFAAGVHEGSIRYEQGNPNLDPEMSLSLDGIVRWLNPHVYLEAGAFVNTIDDFIFPRPTAEVDPASGYFIYAYEQAEARLWGGEASVDIHPHPLDWLHVRLSGDVTLTENLDTGDPLPFSPAPRLRSTLEVDLPALAFLRKASAQLGPTVVAEQTRTAPQEEPTEGYVLWEAGVHGEIPLPGMTAIARLRVENMFDTDYVSHLSRYKPYGVLNPGRNVILEIQFKLP